MNDSAAARGAGTLRRFSYALTGSSVGLLCALMLWPGTRAVVLAQIDFCAPIGQSKAPWKVWNPSRALEPAAPRVPSDLNVQIAAAIRISGNSTDAAVTRLASLRERFPSDASLYATILRLMCRSEVTMPTSQDRKVLSPPSRSAIALFTKCVLVGERVEPNNAFFPMMQAVGRLAVSDESGALAALHQAAGLPLWDDHIQAESTGDKRLYDIAFGYTSALPRFALMQAILFPHIAQLRALALRTSTIAINLESAGRHTEALKLRQDICRAAHLVRAKSTSVLSSLVGGAMLQASIRLTDSVTPVSNAAVRLQDFGRYLRDAGLSGALPEFESEASADAEVRRVVRSTMGAPPYEVPIRLAVRWIQGTVLLSVAGWTLVIAFVVRACAQSSKGAIFAGILGCAGLPFLFLQILSVVTPIAECAWEGPDTSRFLAVSEMGALGSATALVAAWIALSYRLRASLGGFIAAICATALPLAAILLLTFGALVPLVVRDENSANELIRRTVQHEGRYRFEMVGLPWPP